MAGQRPVIGICSAIETARWGAWEALCDLVPRSYSLAVQRAGGLALLLPPDDTVAEEPDELLDLLDGLVLAGGADVDPGSYGARPHAETGATRPERDRFELALGYRALERDLPLLGICRGMQMLNVASGGTIEQHLPERIGSEVHRHTPGSFSDHSVRIAPGSLTSRVVGSGSADVMSHHHQGVGRARRGSRGDRLVRGRRGDRGDRAAGAPLRRWRAVAPGGGRAEPGDRGAGGGGAGAAALTRQVVAGSVSRIGWGRGGRPQALDSHVLMALGSVASAMRSAPFPSPDPAGGDSAGAAPSPPPARPPTRARPPRTTGTARASRPPRGATARRAPSRRR